MATVVYIANARTVAQVIRYTVTAVAVGSTFTATINTKVVTYTVVTGDTTSTAAAALVALLNAALDPEFALATYSVSANIITATAATPGEPFSGMTGGLTFSAGGGVTINIAGAAVNQTGYSVVDTSGNISWFATPKQEANWTQTAGNGFDADTLAWVTA